MESTPRYFLNKWREFGRVVKGEQLKRVAKLPFWAIHGEGDAIPLNSIVTPMQTLTSLNPSSRLLILPKGYTFPDGTPTLHDHLVWIPTLNNLQYNDGTLYRDYSSEPVESTLIEWLNDVK